MDAESFCRFTCDDRFILPQRDDLIDLFRGYNLRDYNENVRRFFLFGIPLIAGMTIQSLLYNLYLTRLGPQEDFIGQIVGLCSTSREVSSPFPSATLVIASAVERFLVASGAVFATTQVGLITLSNPTTLLLLSFLAGSSGAFCGSITSRTSARTPDRNVVRRPSRSG